LHKQYSTRALIASAIFAGPVVQPLAWFFLVPLYSPPISNFTVYWVSYFLWAMFSLVGSIMTSGESNTHQKKSGLFLLAFLISFGIIGALTRSHPILNNVVYSWFQGFTLGFGFGAVAYLLKPSLNVVASGGREEKHREMLTKLTTGSSGEQILVITLHVTELHGPTGKKFDLLFTNQRIIGIKGSNHPSRNMLDTESEVNMLDELIEANPRENFSLRYDEIQSLRLHRFAYWATSSGKLLSFKLGGRTRRFALAYSEDYEEIKRILPANAYSANRK
jgi:hypothetical protein